MPQVSKPFYYNVVIICAPFVLALLTMFVGLLFYRSALLLIPFGIFIIIGIWLLHLATKYENRQSIRQAPTIQLGAALPAGPFSTLPEPKENAFSAGDTNPIITLDDKCKEHLNGSAYSKYCLLHCEECSEQYMLGDNSYIQPLNDILDHMTAKYTSEDVRQQKEVIKQHAENIFFVLHMSMCNETTLECVDIIKKIRRKLNEGIEVEWICSNCSDLSKRNKFPRYFCTIDFLNNDIFYVISKYTNMDSVVIKESFISNILSKVGKKNVEDTDVITLGTVAMEKILGYDPSPTFNDLIRKGKSQIADHYKNGYEIVELSTCTELLQEDVPDWDVPGWIIVFHR